MLGFALFNANEVFALHYDIRVVSKELDIILFADDTNVFFSHKNLNSLIQTVNFELIKLTSWLQVNSPGGTRYISGWGGAARPLIH